MMRIGEVAERSGVSSRMLRHYDALGLVSPSRQPGGDYRAYGPRDLRRLFEVEGLRSLGLSLAEIGEALAGDGPPPTAVLDSLVAEVEDRIARERDLAARLRRARESTPQDWSEVLSSIALLRSLRSPQASERQSAALSTDATTGPTELVAALLTEDDPHVAGALRWRLRHLGADALEPLTTAFDTGDATVRERALRAAVEALPALPSPLLGRALADPQPRIRRIAATTATAHGDPTTIPVLVSLVVDGHDDVEAAEALGALVAADPASEQRVVDDLLAALADPTMATAARIRLVQALGEIPGAHARTALDSLTDDTDHRVAAIAAYCRGRDADITSRPGPPGRTRN